MATIGMTNLSNGDTAPGGLTEAELNSFVTEPDVIPGMNTTHGGRRVDTHDVFDEAIDNVTVPLKWIGWGIVAGVALWAAWRAWR